METGAAPPSFSACSFATAWSALAFAAAAWGIPLATAVSAAHTSNLACFSASAISALLAPDAAAATAGAAAATGAGAGGMDAGAAPPSFKACNFATAWSALALAAAA